MPTAAGTATANPSIVDDKEPGTDTERRHQS